MNVEVLFYDDVILYEDGVGHGYVKLQAKIVTILRSLLLPIVVSSESNYLPQRVMEKRFLILLRLFQSRPSVVSTLCPKSFEFAEC